MQNLIDKGFNNNYLKDVNFLKSVQQERTNKNVKHLRNIIELFMFLTNDTFSIKYVNKMVFGMIMNKFFNI